jgi:hypothetical protein
MKTSARTLLFLCLFFVASVLQAVANVPAVDVTVKEKAGGKVVKQVRSDSNGNFAIGSLPAGAYTLEFRSKQSPELKNKQFAIAIDGAKRSGKRAGISGASLVGGVALNVEVAGGSKLSGQVTTGSAAALAAAGQKKKVVWIPPPIGTHMPGRWVEEGSPEAISAYNSGQLGTKDLQDLQERH